MSEREREREGERESKRGRRVVRMKPFKMLLSRLLCPLFSTPVASWLLWQHQFPISRECATFVSPYWRDAHHLNGSRCVLVAKLGSFPAFSLLGGGGGGGRERERGRVIITRDLP